MPLGTGIELKARNTMIAAINAPSTNLIVIAEALPDVGHALNQIGEAIKEREDKRRSSK
jgi:hypothetical protein